MTHALIPEIKELIAQSAAIMSRFFRDELQELLGQKFPSENDACAKAAEILSEQLSNFSKGEQEMLLHEEPLETVFSSLGIPADTANEHYYNNDNFMSKYQTYMDSDEFHKIEKLFTRENNSLNIINIKAKTQSDNDSIIRAETDGLNQPLRNVEYATLSAKTQAALDQALTLYSTSDERDQIFINKAIEFSENIPNLKLLHFKATALLITSYLSKRDNYAAVKLSLKERVLASKVKYKEEMNLHTTSETSSLMMQWLTLGETLLYYLAASDPDTSIDIRVYLNTYKQAFNIKELPPLVTEPDEVRKLFATEP